MRPSAISNETMLRKFLLTTFLIFIVFYLFSANNYIANNSASSYLFASCFFSAYF